MNPNYQEYQPSASLVNIVDTTWHYSNEGRQDQFREMHNFVPHGMVELIIHLNANRVEGFLNGHWMPFPESSLVGIMKGPVIWRMPGQTSLFGIRFKPESFKNLFGISIKTLANTFLEASCFINKDINSFIQHMQQAPDHQTRISLMESYLPKHLLPLQDNGSCFSMALDSIRNTNQIWSVHELSKSVCISERQLQRVFKENLGIGPKSYIRIIRFRKIYQLLHSTTAISSRDIVNNFKYADQAHFVRDFKMFSGITPKNIIIN